MTPGHLRLLALGALSLGLAACGAVRAPAQPLSLIPMTPAELTYVEQTAAVVYRRESADRLEGLLFSDTRGHGVCVRSPAGATASADYTLLVLQRRVTADFISQADDDIQILRSAGDAAPCRALSDRAALWVRIR